MEKKLLKGILKLCAFVIIANLPFLTITQLLGIDTFIDSFKHPNSYQYIKNDNLHPTDTNGGYVIVKKPTYQGYAIHEGDTIIYYTAKDSLQQKEVYQIVSERGVKTYYTFSATKGQLDGPVYDQQIIGKIMGRFDDNIWIAFCVQIWEISIENLNAVALLTND